MKKSIVLSVFVGAAILLAFGFMRAGKSQEQTTKPLPEVTFVGVDLENVTTTNALTTVLSAAHLPGGIVVRSDCNEDSKYSFNLSGVKLKDSLNIIVSTNPQYKRSADRGVVNLVPDTGVPPLLESRIAELNVQNAATLNEALYKLLSMPDVQQHIAVLRLTPGLTRLGLSDLQRPSSSSERSSKNRTIKRTKITVREALNAIATEFGQGVWEYRERNCGGQTQFQVQFLVQ